MLVAVLLMNNAVRGQVRLGAITHQSLGQDPLKDTSCLNGNAKEGEVTEKGLKGVPANGT